jgi:hypothetical protein
MVTCIDFFEMSEICWPKFIVRHSISLRVESIFVPRPVVGLNCVSAFNLWASHKKTHFYLLELRSTTLSTGWGRPEAEINPRHRSTQDSRQTLSCFTLFNKLLVLPSIRLSILVLRHKRTLLLMI